VSLECSLSCTSKRRYMNLLDVGEIHYSMLDAETGERPGHLAVCAMGVGIADCELKNHAFLLRASGRTVEMEGREVLDLRISELISQAGVRSSSPCMNGSALFRNADTRL
jgi:hypothetical protein